NLQLTTYSKSQFMPVLCITKGLSSSKHTGVRALLNREFVKEDMVEVNWGKFYSEMLDNRQEGDYKDFVKFEKEDVEVWLKKAEGFIKDIQELTLKIIENETKINQESV
ncbi:MAG: HEPN domain-containing protein, partial [bacterium]|nr:HEPN domain-containing protein [bacterium]